MTVPSNLQDPFHRELHAKLQEHLEARVNRLVSGGAAQTESDFASTAEKYAAQVSYIQALREVIQICDDLEQDRFGRKLEDN